MPYFTSVLGPLLAATAVTAVALPRAQNGPGFLSLPIHQVRTPGRGAAVLQRNLAGVDSTQLRNLDNLTHLITLEIGNPAQQVMVILDTGSDELWVNPECLTAPAAQIETCLEMGQYDPDSSSTFQNTSKPFRLGYGIGGVNGTYATDDITLLGTESSLKNVQFGVATASDQIGLGIFGVGWGANLDYPNFIDDLVLQNVTNLKAYSLALGTEISSKNQSAIIFGGVDTKKFVGPLATFPNLPPQNGEPIQRYWIQLTSIGMSGVPLTGSNTTSTTTTQTFSNTTFPVVLDSGSTLHSLPRALLSEITLLLGGDGTVYQDRYFAIPCSALNSTATIDYTFTSSSGSGSDSNTTITIRAPVSDSVYQPLPGECALAASPSDASSVADNILGDPFLRSAYVVFDQDNREISLAQYANCGASVQAIPAAGVAGIASSAGGLIGGCGASASGRPAANGTGAGTGTPLVSSSSGGPSAASVVAWPAVWASMAVGAGLRLF
ncbi:aspartic peptidase domain-containing protein [Xylariales sp. PMI_506]|nr:aspartic peptidase domain-containing protein [Xylariales sp. PMI_506]